MLTPTPTPTPCPPAAQTKASASEERPVVKADSVKTGVSGDGESKTSKKPFGTHLKRESRVWDKGRKENTDTGGSRPAASPLVGNEKDSQRLEQNHHRPGVCPRNGDKVVVEVAQVGGGGDEDEKSEASSEQSATHLDRWNRTWDIGWERGARRRLHHSSSPHRSGKTGIEMQESSNVAWPARPPPPFHKEESKRRLADRSGQQQGASFLARNAPQQGKVGGERPSLLLPHNHAGSDGGSNSCQDHPVGVAGEGQQVLTLEEGSGDRTGGEGECVVDAVDLRDARAEALEVRVVRVSAVV